LVPTREKALALILQGAVFVEAQRAEKGGTRFFQDAVIEVTGSLPYVGRGGLKLEAALQALHLDISGKTILDAGASTGGFTDCLLQRGARRVYAVDVGYGQLDWKLRQDPRVVNLERTHILNFDWDGPAAQGDSIEWITADLAFISLTKVLPLFYNKLPPQGVVLALIKPQFEVGKGEVGKGGIVRDPEKQRWCVEKIRTFAEGLGFICQGIVPSPIPGQKGNREFFIYLVKGGADAAPGSE
jgi:23S rRNA (cytidine1920-2'-O)/16S rRNA (cytidine1409-2'-O)-methyltransferase